MFNPIQGWEGAFCALRVPPGVIVVQPHSGLLW